MLRSRTQGWPAGLRLAAMSLDPTDVDGGIARFSGNERSVADYLVGEVIDRLSAEDRDFLLKTSIAEKVNGNLADFLLSRTDSQFTLEKLVGANAFVVAIGGQNEWFAYHPLMRELLRHRLNLEQPKAVPQLHQRAAGWMLQQSEPIESIRHSILAGDLQGAGRTLLSVVPRILSFEGSALASAIEPLASTAIDNPDLCSLLASATVHFHRWEMQAMMQDVVEAREYLDESDPDLVPSAEVLMLLFEIAAARQQGDGDSVVSAANRVISYLDATPRRLVPAGRPFRVVAEVNLGGGQLWTGDLDAAEQMLSLERAGRAAVRATAAEPERHRPSGPRRGTAGSLPAGASPRHGRRRHHRTPWLGVRTAGRCVLPGAWSGRARSASALPRRPPDQPRADGSSANARTGRSGWRSRLRLCRWRCYAATSTLRWPPMHDCGPVSTRTQHPADLLVRWAAVAGAEALLLADRPADAVTRIGSRATIPGFAASWERVTLARARLALGQHAARPRN